MIRGANVNQLHCMSMSFSLFDAKNFPMIDIQYPHESHESKIHKDTDYIRQNHQRVENQSGKKWQRIEQLYYYKL